MGATAGARQTACCPVNQAPREGGAAVLVADPWKVRLFACCPRVSLADQPISKVQRKRGALQETTAQSVAGCRCRSEDCQSGEGIQKGCDVMFGMQW